MPSIHKITNRSLDSSDSRFCLLHHLHCRHSNPLMWPSRVYGPAAAGDLCHGPWSVTISDLIQFTYLQIDLWWCYEVPGFCGHKLSSVYWKWTAGLSHSHLITQQHCHTVILSHSHLIAKQQHIHIVILSHSNTVVTQSFCHTYLIFTQFFLPH